MRWTLCEFWSRGRRLACGIGNDGKLWVWNCLKIAQSKPISIIHPFSSARSFCWSISPKARQEIRQVCTMRWGLVPSFAKNEEEYNAFKGGNSTFNARIEGAIGSEVCALCRCSLIWPCHARYEKQSSLLRLERLERCWNPKSLETASGQAPLHRTLWWLLWMEGLNETVLLNRFK